MPDHMRPVRILHLEDDPRDAELIQSKLATGGLVCELVYVDNRQRFEAALARDRFDLILCDYDLPDYDGLTALKHAREKQPDARVIVVSGLLGEDEAVRCLHLGAADYLLKQRLERLAPAVRRALEEAAELGRRRESERALASSEARLRQLLMASPVVIYTLEIRDDQLVPVWTSPGLSRFGYQPAETLASKWWSERVHPADRDRAASITPRLLEDGRAEHEYRFRHADGNYLWVHDEMVALRDSAGRYVEVVGCWLDVTERKRGEAALRESETNYRALIEHMGEGLIRVDHDDVIRFVNPQFCRMSGYSEAELLGQHASSLLLREEDRAAMSDRARRRAEGVTEGYEIQLRKRSGELFWTWTSAAPLTGPDGKVSGSMATVVDITERKQAADALRRSHDLLDSTGQLARIGGWELDVESETLTWTDEVYRIHDLEPGAKFKVTEAIDFYAPEARPVIAAAVQNAIDSGTPWDLELPLITARGRRIWVRAQGGAVRQGGRTVRLHGAFQDITERKRAELAAAEAARSLESLLANLPGYMYRAANDPDYTAELISEGIVHLTGYTQREFLADRSISLGELILPEDRDAVWRTVQEAVAAREPFECEYRVRTRSGTVKWLWERGRGFYGPSGELLHLEGFVTDITARRETEQMLLQSQKLEAIGHLAGGVAHDFNNILGVIMGYGEMAKRQLDPGHPVCERLDRMMDAGLRAAELTRQLLAFGRKQDLQPVPLDLNTLVADTNRMLSRLIGADISIRLRQAPDLGTVIADPGKIGQVIMNLAVNARDAMPKGGSLTLETANVDLDVVPGETHPMAEPVRYVLLAVSDTGIGMDEATQRRIFEPFFTTKAEGKGTGLGLATVYGIVKQSGGHIQVYSEPGHGTTFKVYLPRVDEAAETACPASPPTETLSGHETILLVEDTEILREMISESLEELGYTVLTASDGEEALALAGERNGPIDLLLTDVVLPKLGGGDLAAQLSAVRPGLRTVYMSGYTGGTIAQHGVSDDGAVLLEKPFKVDTLARVLREVLDR